jgi:hypothetical protein
MLTTCGLPASITSKPLPNLFTAVRLSARVANGYDRPGAAEGAPVQMPTGNVSKVTIANAYRDAQKVI